MICINDDKMIFIYGSFCDMNAASCVRAQAPNLRCMTPSPESLQAEVWWCSELIINICSLCVLCNISVWKYTPHVYSTYFFCCWFAFLLTSYIFSRFQPCSLTQRNPYTKIWEDRAAMLKEKESTGDSANYGINLAIKKFTLVGLFGGICPSGCPTRSSQKDTKRYGCSKYRGWNTRSNYIMHIFVPPPVSSTKWVGSFCKIRLIFIHLVLRVGGVGHPIL